MEERHDPGQVPIYEAKKLLNIPISIRLPEDKLIWHWENDGEYSVRSVNHLLCNENSKKDSKIYLAFQILTNKIWREFGKPCANQGPNLYMEAC